MLFLSIHCRSIWISTKCQNWEEEFQQCWRMHISGQYFILSGSFFTRPSFQGKKQTKCWSFQDFILFITIQSTWMFLVPSLTILVTFQVQADRLQVDLLFCVGLTIVVAIISTTVRVSCSRLKICLHFIELGHHY